LGNNIGRWILPRWLAIGFGAISGIAGIAGIASFILVIIPRGE
jgi:hypothetical protein